MRKTFLIISILLAANTVLAQDELPDGGINQLSENIQSLLEPVGGGLVSGDDPMISMDGEPGNPGGGDDTIIGDDIPVDGGLSLLLAAGAAYGARRLRRRRDANVGPRAEN